MSLDRPIARKGRGATFNPGNRFRDVTRESVDDGWQSARGEEDAPIATDGGDDDTLPPLRTTVTVQLSRSIIARNSSPDIPFTQSINPYQGCEHGCIYCYARPTHAYLDLSPGLDFETKLFAKPNAVALLNAELAKPGYVCDAIAMGTNTDPYQPIEREWRITRQIIEVLSACDHPLSIVTKSALVERDIDLLAPMAAKNLARVYISITTLDRELARKLEPRAASPQRRLEAIGALAAAGVPVGVMTAPIIPQLTDKDMESILEAAAQRGARWAGWTMLRLPHEVKDLFRDWLVQHYPMRAEHIMSVVRQIRGGRDNDPDFGSRMSGVGQFAELIAKRFELATRRLGFNRQRALLDTSQFRPPQTAPASAQLPLF
jgi:DNA repair photolyase